MSALITRQEAELLGFVQDSSHKNTYDLRVIEYNTLVLCFNNEGMVTRLYIASAIDLNSVTLLSQLNCTYTKVSEIGKALSLKG